MAGKQKKLRTIAIPAFISKAVSSKLLDFAENLPKFQGGFIHSLQQIRETQRKWSKDTFQRTRPPEGTSVEYLGFWLFEMFHYEDFYELKRSIRSLFPEVDNTRGGRTLDDFFENIGEKITSTGWTNIGKMVRPDSKFLIPADPKRVFDDLPHEIENVKVGLHKILPSIMVVSFFVQLNEKASKRLHDLQERRYLSKADLQYVYFNPNFLGFGHSMGSGEMKKEISLWLESLHIGVEKLVHQFMAGVFLSKKGKHAKLPSIELYGIKGHLSSLENFPKWAKDSWNWWDSMNFRFYDRFYSNDTKIVILGDLRQKKENVHRIVALWEPFIESIEKDRYGPNEGYNILVTTNYFVEVLFPFVITLEYMGGMLDRIEVFRKQIYSIMVRGWFSRTRFRKNLAVYHELMKEKRILDRLISEFKNQKSYLKKSFSESDELLISNIHGREYKKRNNLLDGLLDSYDFFRSLITEQIRLIDEALSTHIDVLNIDVLFRLQWITLWLTLLGVVLAVTGITLNWDEIKGLLDSLILLGKKP